MKETSQSITFNPNEVRYLNEKETSRISGKALSTLRNERHRHIGIPYIKTHPGRGGKILYSVQDIVEYMDSHRVNTGR